MKLKTKIVRATIALAVSVMAITALAISPTVFVDIPTPSEADGKAWMKLLDGGKRISQFSIPGTHNSGARFEPIRGTARCQDLTITQQLDMGVRLLDMRCRHLNNAFAIYHGPIYQKLSFDTVLQNVGDFLRDNPSETVILSVQQAPNAQDNTRSFEATFETYVARNPLRWRLASTIPTLDQARGKIVLLRRFDAANRLGIDASNWPDNSTFASGQLRVQDVYQVPDTGAKWNAVVALLQQARAGEQDALYLNFCSGVQPLPLGVPSVTRVAGDINPRVAEFFAINKSGNFGCVIVDFADNALCKAIYSTNFASATPPTDTAITDR